LVRSGILFQMTQTLPDALAYRSNPSSEALLREARREFAEHGMGGARVDRIAERAGVNKQRLYAYFGSKERLFDIVVASVVGEVVDALPLTEGEDLGEHVLSSIAHHSASDDLPRLLMWESLWYHDSAVPLTDTRAAVYRIKVEAMARLLGRSVDEHSAAALFLLIGLATWVTAMRPLAQLILGSAGDPAAFDDAVRKLVADMARTLTTKTD
jgi:AcrR family transcriptional regulator